MQLFGFGEKTGVTTSLAQGLTPVEPDAFLSVTSAGR